MIFLWSCERIHFNAKITVPTLAVGLIFGGNLTTWVLREGKNFNERIRVNDGEIVESDQGVVAADDGRCSDIGASMLRQGGHAVDAAVATALCVGVVNPMSSGIGGGAFMIVRSSLALKTQAFDMRETAPLAASKNMYANNIQDKYSGPLSIGVPGEIAGLHEAWKNLNDSGLKQVFAPNGKLLQAGDRCYNVKLARSLEAVAEQGPQTFYNGTVGEQLVKDVRKAGGILTMEDLKNYKVDIMDAMAANVMGYTVYGMPPPSSGTVGLSLVGDILPFLTNFLPCMLTFGQWIVELLKHVGQVHLNSDMKQVLNIFDSYGTSDAAKGNLGVHRLIEALKHMFAVRMNLGDPKFVDIHKYVSEMLSPSYAEQIRKMILDNTTFLPEYYMNRWSQLRDHGTSHFCIVDAERNAVSMTTTVNYNFGAGVLSPSTGIVLNDEMGDFSAPTEIRFDMLPPAPANFIESNKRPLSSMTPIIVTKDDQLVGVLGGSGGMDIIPAVTQVFINHFVLGMEPLTAVQSPRVYHKLIPNIVQYENFTVIDGDHIEVAEETKLFLEEKGHQLEAKALGAIVQLVVQTLQNPIAMGRKNGKGSKIFHGTLTAVSDPRKDGRPAAI
ncbi:hypothetical protein GH714_038976 [Hevea brasiliensis]|uniref:Glutathione hydrolase n=1 Tax=Hevea brasiliensis TaxID=3981 RepID=A0A6A6K9W4_HEVBR|nr:hypothetical protein GH714_038976 [Hevea brasiliensis]